MYKSKIRKIRIKLGLTLENLSEMTGISVGYLSHLELGTRTNPSIEVMNKISKALKKSVSEIFFSN